METTKETDGLNTRTTRVDFGPYMCEEAVELLDGYRNSAKGRVEINEKYPIFSGTQREWQKKVNFALASRGQQVNWEQLGRKDNRHPPNEVKIFVFVERTSESDYELFQELTFLVSDN